MEETYLPFHRVFTIVGIRFYATKNWDTKPWLFLQIFNVLIGVLTFIFTTGFVAMNVSNLFLFIQGACIWTTGVIMEITLGVCLIFRKEFRHFLEEMAFRDAMLDMPLIRHISLMHHGGEKIAELRNLVFDTQEKIIKYTKMLLRVYVTSVTLTANLYICSSIYGMAVREDKSLRLLGKFEL